MATLSASLAQSCGATGGSITLVSVIAAPGAGEDLVYSWSVINATTELEYGTAPPSSVLPINVDSLPNGPYEVRVSALDPNTNTGYESRVYELTVSCQPMGGGNPPVGTELGYTCQGLDRYRITADGNGGEIQTLFEANSPLCGFEPPILLSVAQPPSDWAPVHLPVLLTLTAEPDGIKPREVLCFVDASSDNGVTWNPCGRIRRTAGENKLVQFNLSEYLKSRFTIVPPVPGLQASLSLRWRVRLGFAPLFTGEEEAEELRLDTLHVVNGAAVNQGLGAYLSDVLPLPAGYDYLLSKITSGGIQNITTISGVEEAPCPPYPIRLVWLNQRGGWNSFVFAGKHEYSTSVEGGTLYEDQTQAQRYADRGAIRPSVSVYSDRLLPELAAVVRTIRRSIQVYQLVDSTAVAVRVEEGSYTDYQAGDKTHTVDFTIIYPRVPVQTQ